MNMMNSMLRATVALSFLISSTDGFAGTSTHSSRRGGQLFGRKTRTIPLRSTTDDRHISFNPMAGYKGVDMDRAQDCAEHFGQCTVEEMQELRDNLHKERMQKFMFSTSTDPHDTVREIENTLEHRLLEEELDLQLSMLRDQNELKSGPGLFPEVEESMAELPHLKEHTHAEHDKHVAESAELALALEETVLEETNLEAIALCAGIAAILLFPHLLNL